MSMPTPALVSEHVRQPGSAATLALRVGAIIAAGLLAWQGHEEGAGPAVTLVTSLRFGA